MTLAAGTRLGPYEIVAPLGAGGMGEVYRARDLRLGRDVAVKIPPPHLARDPVAIARFEREVRAVAALSHPNILDIHDVGHEGDIHFAVTELLDGETLRDRLAARVLPWRTAIEIALAIAEGLTAAHSRGVVHRDLKPENVFLTSDGRVKILDFGLARVESGDVAEASPDAPTATRTGEVLGTIGYMSPEQIRGVHADARSDIFSLGCVLYEMTTGRRAFARQTPPETLVAILREDPPDPRDVSRELPDELRLIVLRCIQKSPEARFQSAQDLAFALRMASLESRVAPGVASALRVRPRYGFVAAAGLVLAALVAVILQRGGPRAVSPASNPGGRDSLAVLPFANAGGDPDMEYLSDGITESLINRLSEIPGLSVIARTTAFQFKGRDPREAGRKLQVGSVLTGQVRSVGRDLIVQADLVDVGTGSQRWGRRFQKPLTGLGSLQEAIAQEISQTLRVKLIERSDKRYTTDAAAYDAYLRGRYYWNKRTEEGAEKSIDYFEEALSRDPAFALGWAGLADSYNLLAFYGWRAPKEILPKSRDAAVRAIEIDESLAEAHASLADVRYQYDWDWNAAERGFRRATRLNPNYATAHQWLSNFLSLAGRPGEAAKEIEIAQNLDPLNPVIDTDAALAPYWAGRFDLAAAELRRVLELEPEFPLAHFYRALVSLRTGPARKAVADARTAVRYSPGQPDAIALYGHACARAGLRREAEQALADLFAMSKKRFVSNFPIAFLYVGLEDNERAIEWLEKAFEERAGRLVYLRAERAFDPLRSDPRFQRMVERLNFPK